MNWVEFKNDVKIMNYRYKNAPI